jgi:hypothetical protein
MDIGRAFTYLTEDEDWIKKVLLGGVITLIPIVGAFFVMGYVLETIKNVIAGQEVPLPEISDFGGKLVKGLIAWLIALIYALPLILLVICGQGGNFAPLLAEGIDQDTLEILTTVSVVLSVCCGCLALLYGILMGLLLPFAWGKYVETEQFGAAFQFSEIFDMLKISVGPAIIALLVSGLAGIVAALVGTIVCGVGLLFTSFYAQLVTAFLYGSLYRQAKGTVL